MKRSAQLLLCVFLVVSLNGCRSRRPQAAPADWGIHRSLWMTPTDIGCAPPSTNCFDDVVVTPAAASLAALDRAVDTGRTAQFFSGREWRAIFPGLQQNQRQLQMLQRGMPLVRFENEPNVVRYVATRMTREALLAQTRPGTQVTVGGVEFCLTVRKEGANQTP